MPVPRHAALDTQAERCALSASSSAVTTYWMRRAWRRATCPRGPPMRLPVASISAALRRAFRSDLSSMSNTAAAFVRRDSLSGGTGAVRTCDTGVRDDPADEDTVRADVAREDGCVTFGVRRTVCATGDVVFFLPNMRFSMVRVKKIKSIEPRPLGAGAFSAENQSKRRRFTTRLSALSICIPDEAVTEFSLGGTRLGEREIVKSIMVLERLTRLSSHCVVAMRRASLRLSMSAIRKGAIVCRVWSVLHSEWHASERRQIRAAYLP